LPAKLTELVFTSRLVFHSAVLSSTAKLTALAVKKKKKKKKIQTMEFSCQPKLKVKRLGKISAWLSGLL